jgi:hypothetical protein
LRFDPKTQQLQTIEVFDVSKVKLLYSSSTFCTFENTSPTFVSIYEKFGPTHPGEYDPNTSLYLLHYPVSFQTSLNVGFIICLHYSEEI